MKPLFVISSPFDTYSGYGARARDLVKAIIETDKYEVRLMSQRWGNTPFGFCKDNPEWEFLLEKTLLGNQLTRQPDIWAQVTVPNEFQRVGKFNIGFTAGIETTVCAGEWIDGCNRMDLNIVSSEHSKKVFQNSKFEKRNKGFIQRVKIKRECCKCGLKHKPYLLEFHHLEPNTKYKSVTDLQFNAYGMKLIKDEIRKCVIICRNCHAEFHHLERQNIVRTFKEYLKLII